MIAKADVRMVGVLALHDEPASQHRRLLYVQLFSDIGPRLVGQLTIQLDPKTMIGVVGQGVAPDIDS